MHPITRASRPMVQVVGAALTGTARRITDAVYGRAASRPECSGIFKGRPVMEQCMDLGSGLEWGTTG